MYVDNNKILLLGEVCANYCPLHFCRHSKFLVPNRQKWHFTLSYDIPTKWNHANDFNIKFIIHLTTCKNPTKIYISFPSSDIFKTIITSFYKLLFTLLKATHVCTVCPENVLILITLALYKLYINISKTKFFRSFNFSKYTALSFSS